MKLKKHLSMLAAGMLTAVVLVATGAVKTDASVVLAAGNNMNVSATISGGNVNVVANATSAPASDDGMLYLFAEPMSSDTITTSAVASAPAGTAAAFTTSLDANSAGSKLYSKFIVAAKQGGTYVPLNPGAYITNPEAIATKTFGRSDRGKKGLLTAPEKLDTGEFVDLGVKQVLYNIPVGRILGPTQMGAYPTINYTYNGKTYQMNGLAVAEFDNIFGKYTRGGASITACLINEREWMGRSPVMYHPMARTGASCPCYLFNNAEQSGVEAMAAVGSFLAQRYSDGQHGRVDNWVVGNEVNIQDEWNYCNIPDINVYAREYGEGLRVFYNAIKSTNANARVYICTEHQWDRNPKGVSSHGAVKFDGKDFVDSLNNYVVSTGNIDWGLMTHPYPVPLTWAAYWTGGAYYRNLVTHSPSTAFVSMENIEVLTDYFCRQELLAPNGQVRSIITGCGYTSTQGENYANAAMVLGYQAAANNQHIDAFFIAQEMDNAASIAQGLAVGLSNADGSHKSMYDCYKQLDGPNQAAYIQQALALRGASSLAQVVHAR